MFRILADYPDTRHRVIGMAEKRFDFLLAQTRQNQRTAGVRKRERTHSRLAALFEVDSGHDSVDAVQPLKSTDVPEPFAKSETEDSVGGSSPSVSAQYFIVEPNFAGGADETAGRRSSILVTDPEPVM